VNAAVIQVGGGRSGETLVIESDPRTLALESILRYAYENRPETWDVDRVFLPRDAIDRVQARLRKKGEDTPPPSSDPVPAGTVDNSR
jgi:hypothetical protein